MDRKRILSLLTAGAVVLALSGCQSKGDSSSAQNDGTATGVAVQTRTIQLSSVATDNSVSGKVAADSQTSVMVAATSDSVLASVRIRTPPQLARP